MTLSPVSHRCDLPDGKPSPARRRGASGAAFLVQAGIVAWLGIETKRQPLEALAAR
jgi:hypothetical protein